MIQETLRRVRRNHALEHATVTLMLEEGVGGPLGGYSTPWGLLHSGQSIDRAAASHRRRGAGQPESRAERDGNFTALWHQHGRRCDYLGSAYQTGSRQTEEWEVEAPAAGNGRGRGGCSAQPSRGQCDPTPLHYPARKWTDLKWLTFGRPGQATRHGCIASPRTCLECGSLVDRHI